VGVSRIRVNIDRLVLQGVDGVADRTALVEGLQGEIARALSGVGGIERLARSQRTPVLKLDRMPMVSGPSGARNFGSRLGGAIVKRLQP
jgi:hypothetical protein